MQNRNCAFYLLPYRRKKMIANYDWETALLFLLVNAALGLENAIFEITLLYMSKNAHVKVAWRWEKYKIYLIVVTSVFVLC